MQHQRKTALGNSFKHEFKSQVSVLSFTLTGKPYTYPDFIDHVKEWQGRTGQDLRIVCYVSNLGTEELLDSL